MVCTLTICQVFQYYNGYRFSSVYIVQHDCVCFYTHLGQVHPEMRWSIVLVLILQNLHLGSAPLWRILAWKFLVKRLWSCAATTNLSASTLSLALLGHWWVSCKSTSAFWFQRGYWPFPFFLAILASSSNSLASLTTESGFFLFYTLKLVAASSRLINSSTKRPIVDVL